MLRLLDHLASFNRKERFYVVGAALGNPTFRLCSAFRRRLEQALGIAVPADAFVAMDYHLDWLHAALALAAGTIEGGVHPNRDRGVRGTQEDVDLLIAFDRGRLTHVLMVEAKVEGRWSNAQMLSKARRLAALFGVDGARSARVRPHFVLMSPRSPRLLATDGWPRWMAPRGSATWIRLDVPRGLRRVERCNIRGDADARGSCFHVVRRSAEDCQP